MFEYITNHQFIMISYGSKEDLFETKISWFQYLNIRCGLGREGKFFNYFQYVLFIAIGFLLCNISTIIFYFQPHLLGFDLSGPAAGKIPMGSQNNDTGLLLFSVTGVIGFLIIAGLIIFIELPCVLFRGYRLSDNYAERYNNAKWTIIIYIFIIITSNILGIIVFKYPTQKSIMIPAIPFVSTVIVIIIILLMTMIYQLFCSITYVLFIVIGGFLCNISTIIFYFQPHLFDLLEFDLFVPEMDNDAVGPVLFSMMGTLSLFMIIVIRFGTDLHYTPFCGHKLSMNYIYVFTIITSNIFAIIVLKYLMRNLIIIIPNIPLVSLMLVYIIIFLMTIIHLLFCSIFDCFVEDKQEVEKMLETKKI
jgi:hypothetical protein